jgi:predicted nucleic-acid-binding Zn-ribbon protein
MAMMPHSETLACPKCGQDDDFHVDITGTAYIGKAGAEVLDDYQWDHHSTCTCLECCFESRFCAFIKPKAVQP